MCGIYFILSSFPNQTIGRNSSPRVLDPEQRRLLCNRGPNHCKEVYYSFTNSYSQFQLFALCSVLGLRGTPVCAQPFELPNEGLLLFNGELFEVGLPESLSDTEILAQRLQCAKDVCDLCCIFSGLRGPWSLVYWQKEHGRLWFGRDALGRRSLLWSFSTSPSITIRVSSVVFADDTCEWFEVPSDGLYCADVNNLGEDSESVPLTRFSWSRTVSGFDQSYQMSNVEDCTDDVLSELPINLPPNINISDDSQHRITTPINCPLNHLLPLDSCELWISIKQTIQNVCSYRNEVCQHNESDVNTLTSRPMNGASLNLRDIEVGVLFDALLRIPSLYSLVQQFEDVLSDSVKIRVIAQQDLCHECFEFSRVGTPKSCLHCSTAILFSGGLDSAVLTLLADRFVPSSKPIDLLNVSFCNEVKKPSKRKTKLGGKTADVEVTCDTPDRISGRQTLEELEVLCPLRDWNFVPVDVTKEELQKQRDKCIRHLVCPCKSVLDDSIGCALWFAARGCDKDGYVCPARVVLLGIGADEQLGGYSRHRGKFKSGGWNSLIQEIAMEIDRISKRNLGRDDRIVSDHGREARFPFLDEKVVSFLNNVPVYCKAYLDLPRGVGEKLLLRLLAWKLGFKNAAVLHKRAIQFGSRIARLESSKEKGNEKCIRLLPQK